jgi:Type I phosphodiesterase / nucleotide pyrophosphatase
LRAAATPPVTTQVVVLGFDGADPNLAAKWMAEGKLPNLKHLADTGTFRPLGTTNPPESPVAWASFATGLNPGGTGIFDFLTRDPQTYLPELALVSRKKPKFLFGLIPIRGPRVTNERSGVPFYKATADAGYTCTSASPAASSRSRYSGRTRPAARRGGERDGGPHDQPFPNRIEMQVLEPLAKSPRRETTLAGVPTHAARIDPRTDAARRRRESCGGDQAAALRRTSGLHHPAKPESRNLDSGRHST